MTNLGELAEAWLLEDLEESLESYKKRKDTE